MLKIINIFILNLLTIYCFNINAAATAATVAPATKTVNLKDSCSTVCQTAAAFDATNSNTNTLCDFNGQTINNCDTKAIYKLTFTCPSDQDQDSCTASCISKCSLLKAMMLSSAGVADVSANVSSNSFTRSMCNALRVVTGSAGKTFAAFAIIAVGIGFFSGKVSWGLMIGVAAGIAAMFGAPSIVAAISGQDTNMTCDIN